MLCRYTKKYGFTLLEVLIVIIVAAVLTSVALPGYRHLIIKSRYKSMLPLAKALYLGQEHFWLTHGRYAQEVSDLDVTVNQNALKNVSVLLHNSNEASYVKLAHQKLNNTFVLFNEHSPHNERSAFCEAKEGDNAAVWLCEKSLHGVLIPEGSLTSGYKTYALIGHSDLEGDSSIELPAPITPTVVHSSVSYTDQSGTEEESLVLQEGDTCVASNSSQCQHLETYGAECTANGANGCSYSEFNEESTCNAGAQGGCFRSTFTDSECVVTVGGANANTTSCGGKDVADEASRYIHSSCTNKSSNGYACSRSTYEDLSVCMSNEKGGCGKSKFIGYSVCEGNSSSACDRSQFYDHSVCYANAPGACLKDSTTYYDDTSYCAGDYCPTGTPKQGGGTWTAVKNGKSY